MTGGHRRHLRVLRRAGRRALVVVAIVLSAVFLGAPVGVAAPLGSSATPTGCRVVPAPASTPGDTGGSDESDESDGSQDAGGGLDAAAARVAPGLVDLTSVLRDGAGQASGTGIVLSGSGLVVTNAHVVADAARTRARDVDTGDDYTVKILTRDTVHDLAVLQMQDAQDLTVAPLGTSSGVRRGDPVAAVGNAGGLGGDPVVTTGTVTDLGRSVTATDDDGSHPERLTGLIQVSARVRPGDSGGALVDDAGHVIGITTATDVATGGHPASGYAIPIDQVTAFVRRAAGGATAGGATTGGTPGGGDAAADATATAGDS